MWLSRCPKACRHALLGVALSSAAWSAVGFLYLRSIGANSRLRPIEELNLSLEAGKTGLHAIGAPEAQKAFLAVLQESGFSQASAGTIATTLELQTWVGNQVTRVDLYEGPERGFELLQRARRGEGLACSGMSDILREALLLLGVPARTVHLTGSNFRLRAHSLVEAYVEGRWRVFDPTFNVTFESDGSVLGVSEIQDRLWQLGPGGIQAVFHGKRRYPVELERDAPGWRQYFANAYVMELGAPPDRLRDMPPWRYWMGPSVYYFGDRRRPLPALQDRLYFFVTVVLPAVAIVTALLAVNRSPRRAADGILSAT
jgi:hypothetical protein